MHVAPNQNVALCSCNDALLSLRDAIVPQLRGTRKKINK